MAPVFSNETDWFLYFAVTNVCTILLYHAGHIQLVTTAPPPRRWEGEGGREEEAAWEVFLLSDRKNNTFDFGVTDNAGETN